MDKKEKNQNGYTLIEVVVVFTVLAIIFLIINKFTGWPYPVEGMWKYVAFFLFSYSLILAILTFVLFFIQIPLKFDEEKIFNLALPFIILVSLFITYGSLSYFGINFPSDIKRKSTSNFKQGDSLLTSELLDFNKRANFLSESIKNIGNLKLDEVIPIVDELSDLIAEYKKVANEQNEKIESLKKSAIDANYEAEQAIKLLKEIKSMTKAQIDAVKILITEDASVQAKRWFFFGAALSVPLGILSSIIASSFVGNKDKLKNGSS